MNTEETGSFIGRYYTRTKQQGDSIMPVFVIPLLVGIPVLVGGGYLLIYAFK